MQILGLVTDTNAENPTVGDLALNLGSFVQESGARAAGQSAHTRLNMFKGEWFRDLRQGVPYYQEILRKGVDDNRVKAIVRQAVLSVPGIVDMQTISVVRTGRSASVTWTARYQDGTTILSADYGPLIIESVTDGA